MVKVEAQTSNDAFYKFFNEETISTRKTGHETWSYSRNKEKSGVLKHMYNLFRFPPQTQYKETSGTPKTNRKYRQDVKLSEIRCFSSQ